LNTPRRTVRIDSLWEEAQGAASERGENLSDVIREALRQYVNNHLEEKREPMTNYTITSEAIDEAAEAIRVGIDRRSIWDLAKAAVEAAAPFLRAQALEEAADEQARRSETFMKTMQNMVGNPEYGHEDIIRYGAFSAEANSTAYRLRTRATTEVAS